MRKRYLLGILMAVIVCTAVGFMAVSATTEEEIPLKKPSKLTEDELNRIYEKYNVSENDIKFAKDNDPYGTILHNSSVLAIESSDLLNKEHMQTVVNKTNPDAVITIEERKDITSKARERYIKKYGVDPAIPEIYSINGTLLPKEYAKKLWANGIIGNSSNNSEGTDSTTCGTSGVSVEDTCNEAGVECTEAGPKKTQPGADGEFYVYIFEAKDNSYGHAPEYDTWLSGITLLTSLRRISVELYYRNEYWNEWDVSDISPADNSSEAIEDLSDDFGWAATPNSLVVGWADNLDHNGIAWCDTSFSVDSETPVGVTWDWNEDDIAQHEFSHNFNAGEGGSAGNTQNV